MLSRRPLPPRLLLLLLTTLSSKHSVGFRMCRTARSLLSYDHPIMLHRVGRRPCFSLSHYRLCTALCPCVSSPLLQPSSLCRWSIFCAALYIIATWHSTMLVIFCIIMPPFVSLHCSFARACIRWCCSVFHPAVYRCFYLCELGHSLLWLFSKDFFFRPAVVSYARSRVWWHLDQCVYSVAYHIICIAGHAMYIAFWFWCFMCCCFRYQDRHWGSAQGCCHCKYHLHMLV